MRSAALVYVTPLPRPSEADVLRSTVPVPLNFPSKEATDSRAMIFFQISCKIVGLDGLHVPGDIAASTQTNRVAGED